LSESDLDLMVFYVIPQDKTVPEGTGKWVGYLNRDKWNDWGKYCTQFYLTVVSPEGTKHSIGDVKIGQKGLQPGRATEELVAGYRTPTIFSNFEQLSDDFFSLGQDEEYYVKIGKLGDKIRERILKSLRDVAFDNNLWESVQIEDVLHESLLRFVTPSTVKGQFHRISLGDAKTTAFNFTYFPPTMNNSSQPPFQLTFKVNPNSPIPSNVHVIIGRNGVGKTRLLSRMANCLTGPELKDNINGMFKFDETYESFTNLVVVSFSAFDINDLPQEKIFSKGNIGYSYIGLRDSSTTADKKYYSVKVS
jgi:hypothetical protein